MQEKINVAKLLKGCPSGMELDCTMYNKVSLLSVSDSEDIIFPIKVIREDGHAVVLTKYGQYTDANFAKCVIFPKGKDTWEGFQRPFKDGDIVACDCCHGEHNQVLIFKEYSHHNDAICHAILYPGGTLYIDEATYRVDRFATEEEKQRLFDAIKDEGYVWNAEKKELEKVAYRNGDIVSTETGRWIGIVDEFSHKDYYKTYVTLGENILYYSTVFSFSRLATEEEKQKLFQALKKDRYKWNAEKKEVEKFVEPKFKVGNKVRNICSTRTEVIESLEWDRYRLACGQYIKFSDENDYELVPDKFDVSTLKPFDKVLVRHGRGEAWYATFFSCIHVNEINPQCRKFVSVAGKFYPNMIPYEGNEHLANTTNDCDEYFKTW